VDWRTIAAQELDRDVARGNPDIARTVARLDRQRMRSDAELLRVALERDLIDAGDFTDRGPSAASMRAASRP
jgi:hypothetical protein